MLLRVTEFNVESALNGGPPFRPPAPGSRRPAPWVRAGAVQSLTEWQDRLTTTRRLTTSATTSPGIFAAAGSDSPANGFRRVAAKDSIFT
jgi:hypothetical protein